MILSGTGVSGDLSNLARLNRLTVIGLAGCRNVYGDLSRLGSLFGVRARARVRVRVNQAYDQAYGQAYGQVDSALAFEADSLL